MSVQLSFNEIKRMTIKHIEEVLKEARELEETDMIEGESVITQAQKQAAAIRLERTILEGDPDGCTTNGILGGRDE